MSSGMCTAVAWCVCSIVKGLHKALYSGLQWPAVAAPASAAAANSSCNGRERLRKRERAAHDRWAEGGRGGLTGARAPCAYSRPGIRCVRSGTPSHTAVQACNTMYCQRRHTDTLRSYATGWEGRPLVKTYYTMALPCS